MLKKGGKFLFLIFFLGLQVAEAAPTLRIAGSSAVFPFAATVAEYFHYKTNEPTPLIEGIGTGAGIKLFCEGARGLDGVMASRPFTESEIKKCQQQNINFQEFKIGQDGLVLIEQKRSQSFPLKVEDLRNAIAEKVLVKGECLKNPYKMWNQIETSFPTLPLRILGPAPASGTYDVLLEKIQGPCGPLLRHDGVYIEAPANENLIVQKVLTAHNTIGIVTFSFYEQNKNRIQAFSINGVFPSLKTIQDGLYPLSRPLYVYIKLNDLSNHLSRLFYMREFTSPEAIGESGYLTKKGLIPLPQSEQRNIQKDLAQFFKTGAAS